MGRFFLIAGLLVIGLTSGVAVTAAEPQFVGVLAIALEGDMPGRLELTPAQRDELLAIVDRREEEALELVLELEQLPPEVQRMKLAPFRQESERQGLAVLTAEQRAILEQERLGRAGLSTLGEANMAATLELSNAQREQIDRLLRARDEAMTTARRDDRDQIAGQFERQLADVLTDEQRGRWDQMAGGAAAAVAQAAPSGEMPPDEMPPAAQPAEPRSGDEDAESPVAADAPANGSVAGDDVGDGLLRFNFRFQPWADVLEWFAEQADLSLIMESPPAGTFNYTDNRAYTPEQAIDLLNSVLLTKGYTLVRRERMLILVNLEDGIPPNLVPIIPSEQLDERGEYELVSTLFDLNYVDAQTAADEISGLIGPQGAVVVLAQSRQLQVTETAGRLRMIRSVLARADRAPGGEAAELKNFTITHALPDEVLTVVRQLLDIPEGTFVSNDGTVRIAIDPLGNKLLVAGAPDKVRRVEEILQVIDVPLEAADGSGGIIEMPQLEVYSVTGADPNSVLAVLQTLMVNFADVRLAIDPVTGNLVALARPSQHATIRATIEQMQRDDRQVEVIRLSTIDASLAVEAINALFGGGGETPSATAPQVEPDPSGRQLLVRGSEAQIEQIRQLLEKMGETVSLAGVDGGGGNVRMLPYSSRTAQAVLEQLEALWPAIRSNQIKVVTPSAVIPTLRPSQTEQSGDEDAARLMDLLRGMPPRGGAPASPAQPEPEEQPRDDAPSENHSAHMQRSVNTAQLAAWVQPADAETSSQNDPNASANDEENPPIVVAPGPGGVMIASEDLEALDEFEALFDAMAANALSGASAYTVFYLENADARVIAETLTSIFSGGVATGGGGGSLLGDLAGAALGDAGGGLMGALLGLGGGGGSGPTLGSGSLLIVPETRLNALVVQGTPAELDTIEQLLRILDQPDAPITQVSLRPKLIPVLNTSATQIANIVKEVFQENMVSSGGNRQPSPEQLIQLLRGGRDGGGGAPQRTLEDTMKMTVSVDARTNSLIVAAPQSLFEQVEHLVLLLDQQTAETNQAIRVVTLKRGNPQTVSQALAAITGGKVTASTSGEAASQTQRQDGDRGDGDRDQGNRDEGRSDEERAREEAEQMRRRMEFFNMLRERMGGGSDGRGGGDSRGFPGRGGGDRD